MSNTLLTIDDITKESLRVLHEKLSFIGTVNRQFDESFSGSGKIGDTLRIRKPARYVRRQGSRVMDVQDSVQESTSLVVATQDGVDLKFNSRELALDLQNFSKDHIEPAISVLASGIEGDFLAGVTKKVWNVAGTPGTAITDLAAVGTARARLNQGLAPKDGNRYIQMDSVTMGGMVNGLKGLFQDSEQIKTQYREGLIGRTAMADFYENERVWTMSNSADVTVTTAAAAAVTDGGTNITLASVANATSAGMVFTVAGVYACHPETKQAYSNLQDFTIITGGTTTQEVSPAIYLTGARKNVCKADGSDLAASDFNGTSVAVTFRGAASTSYVQNLMYHKDAFTFATGALPMMADAAKCSVRTFDGLSIRIWQGSDIRNDEMLTRLDILYGYAAIRPEWACRLIGAAN